MKTSAEKIFEQIRLKRFEEKRKQSEEKRQREALVNKALDKYVKAHPVKKNRFEEYTNN